MREELAGLLVGAVDAAVRAVLFELQPFLVLALVFHRGVIAVLTFRALHVDDHSNVAFGHVFPFLMILL